jgi:hypothetical protein
VEYHNHLFVLRILKYDRSCDSNLIDLSQKTVAVEATLFVVYEVSTAHQDSTTKNFMK